MSARPTLIRPGQLGFARMVYDGIHIDELKRERAQLRADQLEAAQRRLDRIDLELAGLNAIRARELKRDLAASGFDTTELRPPPLPTQLERDARGRRGRAESVDAMTRAQQEQAAERRCLVRVFTPRITIR